jgi:predicted RNA binding protein YcfA (HicA-like mRNA interferase family)
MASLPALSGREVVRVFESFGWSVARQRGSHIIMTRSSLINTRATLLAWHEEKN